MIVDGRHLTEGERLRLLDSLQSDDQPSAPANPAQLEMFKEQDDVRYQWKDEQVREPVGRGCLIAIGISAIFWAILATVVLA